MTIIQRIKKEIESKSGMFDERFDSAFDKFIESFHLNPIMKSRVGTYSLGKNTNRKTKKGGTRRMMSGMMMMMICIITIISFSIEAQKADEFVKLLSTNKDLIIQENIIPFLTYLREKNPLKGSVGWVIATTFTSQSLVPIVSGLYNKSVLMMTGDIVLSGQLISLIINIDKYLLIYMKKQEERKDVEANIQRIAGSLQGAMLQIEDTPNINRNRVSLPSENSPNLESFTYDLPLGSKLVTTRPLI